MQDPFKVPLVCLAVQESLVPQARKVLLVPLVLPVLLDLPVLPVLVQPLQI
jgi:hypothetical protein